MAINTIKTLKLTLDGTEVECQLTRAALVDSPDTEELTTFCGTETSAMAVSSPFRSASAGCADAG